MEFHLFLFYQGSLVDLVCGLHCQLSFQDCKHIFCSRISHTLARIHEFFHHLAVDEHFIHSLLEILKVVGHGFEVGVSVAVAKHLGHFVEAAHDCLVILHSLHVAADELHF